MRYIGMVLRALVWPFAAVRRYFREIDDEIADAKDHQVTGSEAALQGSVTTSLIMNTNPS